MTEREKAELDLLYLGIAILRRDIEPDGSSVTYRVDPKTVRLEFVTDKTGKAPPAI